MLYDPKWDKTKATPSVEGLLAWLEQQPADGCYRFTEPSACVAGRYYASIGQAPRAFIGGVPCSVEADLGVDGMRLISALHAEPQTYGAALYRLRAIL